MTATGQTRGLRLPRRGPPRPRKPGWDEGWREFVTPEGVDLRLKVGAYSERLGAFLLDFLILFGGLIGLNLILVAIAWATKSRNATTEAVLILWLLGGFLARNGYFIFFELRPGAATPGKRAVGLRVAARDGGRLTANAVFIRNAMREIEIFLPVSLLFAQGQGVDAGLVALGAVWSGVFLLFPLFNRDRLRLGDIAAGTMVVKAPKRLLRPDLASDRPAPSAGLTFTDAQLDAYGIKELHVLEDVLRRGERRTIADVSGRIRKKIGWEAPLEVSDRAFLQAYYAGLRGRLEGQLLFGRRRADKFDKP
jgi:uncharacterized RDD family membrane protein YckC